VPSWLSEEERQQEGEPSQPEPAPAPSAAEPGKPSLNAVSFDELRDLGMSVTQARRVIAYRDRGGGFKSLDELDSVPGFPKDFLAALKKRLTV
jgi:DNA uptake protein ComE-like DNA-binding protein